LVQRFRNCQGVEPLAQVLQDITQHRYTDDERPGRMEVTELFREINKDASAHIHRIIAADAFPAGPAGSALAQSEEVKP
jgi:hypothetical protein